MEKKRKIEIAANLVDREDEDAADIIFWLDKTELERLQEVYWLRQNFFQSPNHSFPKKIAKTNKIVSL
ncbi:hypothetical protein [Pararhodonellum marinum]|uniref:hypothetical protein n=1 Tax=Pararhodonellum marinum TaxID=2755358 RepID=UPI0018901C4E|nr:hypothetical protein [Pararhodonellum marinum]